MFWPYTAQQSASLKQCMQKVMKWIEKLLLR